MYNFESTHQNTIVIAIIYITVMYVHGQTVPDVADYILIC